MAAPIGTNLEIVVQGHCITTGGTAKKVVNNFHYSAIAGAGSPPPKTSIFSAFNSSIWAGIAAALSTDYVAEQVTIRFIDDATDAPINSGTQNNGSAGAGHVDLATAVVFYLKTGLRGKNYRGFKHYGPILPAHCTGDELNSTGITAWSGLTSNHVASFTVTGWTWVPCVFSRTLSQSLTNPTSLVLTQIATARMNKTLGTMKHRKEKTVF